MRKYPIQQQFQAHHQNYGSALTPTPSRHYGNRNIGQRNKNANIDIVTALLDQYLPRHSNVTDNFATVAMGGASSKENLVLQDLLKKMGIQLPQAPELLENPQPSIQQIQELTTILAASQSQSKPVNPERRSDELGEVKELLKDLVLEIRKQNRTSSPRRDRSRDRSTDKSRNTSPNAEPENPFAPNLSLQDLNELLARGKSASAGPQTQNKLHHLSSTHQNK